MVDVFSGQERERVLTKAVLAAALIPTLEEVEDIEPGDLGYVDDVMEGFLARIKLLGYTMTRREGEEVILDRLGQVIRLEGDRLNA
jgi:hypothetical protein